MCVYVCVSVGMLRGSREKREPIHTHSHTPHKKRERAVGVAFVLAGILGVSVKTVQRWLSGGVQSCNVNAEKLIQVALEYSPERTLELLEKDLERHIISRHTGNLATEGRNREYTQNNVGKE